MDSFVRQNEMIRTCVAAILIVIATTSSSIAADAAPTSDDRSTVKLFFVNIPITVDANPNAAKEMAHVGDMVLPTSEVRPASIYIDGDFVGNALSGYVDVKPSFRLPPGTHDFRVECDGCATFESKLQVLGNGSEQWLVVTFRPTPKKVIAAQPQGKKD